MCLHVSHTYSAAPTYGAVAHTAVWGIATLSTVIPAICCREPGLGMSDKLKVNFYIVYSCLGLLAKWGFGSDVLMSCVLY